MLNLAAAAVLFATTADAAPKRNQLHFQAQTGLMSREALRVDETDLDRRDVQVGPGAGGLSLGVGYQLRANSEVGGRFEMSRMTVDDGVSDVQQGHARVAGTYTHFFRMRAPLHFAATGMFGLERASFDGAALARSPFIGASGNFHWFATPRLSVNMGVEATRSLGGRYEEDGLVGSSRFTATDVAAVAGLNFYVGAGKVKLGRRR